MNSEDLDNLPQPPEGVLDPKQSWWTGKVGEKTWVILKAKLTGGEAFGTGYSSAVNLTNADADKLIENLKKDPRGYPQMDDGGGGMRQMENIIKYQEWLREEYLEKPFRKMVDNKIYEADTMRVVNNAIASRNEKNIIPQTPLIPQDLPEKKQVSEISPQIIPTEVKQKEELPLSITPKKLTIPKKMPSNVLKAINKYGYALNIIGNEIEKHNFILRANLGQLRKITEDLEDVKFFLTQIGENYQEALDDFEMEKRKQDARKKFFKKIIFPFAKPEKNIESSTTEKTPEPEKNKFNSDIFNKNKQNKILPTLPPKKLAEGGVFAPTTNNVIDNNAKIIYPGIYTKPVRGVLAPGSVVIPRNRNTGKNILNMYDFQQYSQSFIEVMTKPTNALLGYAMSIYASILRGLGPLSGYFNTNIPNIISPMSIVLGLSRNTIIDMLGGPAYAGVAPNKKEENNFYISWKKYMKENNLFFFGIKIDKEDTGAGEGLDLGGGVEIEASEGLDTRTAASYDPFDDTDGNETGIDISLAGKGTNGYGRGLSIRNPIENLYYFSKVPKEFARAGQPTRGINGSAERNKVSGFGHWATYYIKDNDGTFYELLMGHLDKPAPTWNDSGQGVRLNKGVKIGVQGASGSTSGNTPDGTYDHMTTHINSGGRNTRRAGELLLKWANDLNSYKAPKQPSLERGGEVKRQFASGGSFYEEENKNKVKIAQYTPQDRAEDKMLLRSINRGELGPVPQQQIDQIINRINGVNQKYDRLRVMASPKDPIALFSMIKNNSVAPIGKEMVAMKKQKLPSLNYNFPKLSVSATKNKAKPIDMTVEIDAPQTNAVFLGNSSSTNFISFVDISTDYVEQIVQMRRM